MNNNNKDNQQWVSVKKNQPGKKGFYTIKGLNNSGRPAQNNDIWFTGTFWMIREGCVVTHWKPQPPSTKKP